MLSVPQIIRLCAVSALFCTAALADTITLKTGEKLEGKILSETATEITVAVKISASITDEQVIAKANVEKVDKEMPDEIAWLPLKNLKLGQNSLQAAQYDTLMRPLQGFVNEFPQSPHAAEASQLLATFAGEKARVDAGEVRMGEKWLTAEEVGQERYQLQAQIAVQYLRGQRMAGDFIGVLNSFELIEKNFPGAQTYPDAVETVRETLTTLKVGIERAQQIFATRKAEFEAGLASAAPGQNAELMAARQRELAVGETALAVAEKAKVKWPVLIPSSDKNLDAIAKKIPTELQRLVATDVGKLRQAAQLAEQGRKEIADKNPEAVDTLAKAIVLSQKNELAKRLQPDALALKTAAASAAQVATQTAAAAARATPVPTATPVPKASDVAQAEPEKSFFLGIGGIITLVVLLAAGFAGWAAYNKIRQRANDVLE